MDTLHNTGSPGCRSTLIFLQYFLKYSDKDKHPPNGDSTDENLHERQWEMAHPLQQWFSIPVLAPPRSAYFVCYSYRFRCLFYSNVSALRSGHHRIFLHDSSSKRTYSIQSALKCERRELKLYIFTEVYDVTLVRA